MINTVSATLFLVGEIAVLFLGVTVAVQLFQARFGAERLRSWMGGHPVMAALKGISLGFVTPFCTFTAVPMLVGLRQAKVPAAGYVAFVVAAPVLDPVLFGALVLIAGPTVALLYAAIAFAGAIVAALLAQRVGIERHLAPVDSLVGPSGAAVAAAPEAAPGSGCGREPSRHWRGLRAELPGALRAAVGLLKAMTPILLAGVALSVLIEELVPPELTGRLTSAAPALSIPVAAGLGTPLYVSTTVFIPIADALTSAGVGIGAIVALTIAGAGANLPEFVILSKLARPRVIATFFIYVFAVAVAGGFITDAIVG